MTLRTTLKTSVALALLAVCGELGIGTDQAQAQLVAVPTYGPAYVTAPVVVRAPRRARVVTVLPTTVAVPTTVVTAPPTVVTETRYVSPVVSAPVVQRRYVPRSYVVPTAPVVGTSVIQTVPVIERQVITYPY